MNRQTLIKIAVALLFALAIIFGLSQRDKQNTHTLENVPSSAQDNLDAYFQKAHDLAAQQQQKTTATFLAVGDIMLSRSVALAIQKAGDPALPFSKMTDIFRSVDFSFGNLESPFSDNNHFNPSGSMVFNAPKDNIKGLVDNRFKILFLANNHALDQGIKGLDYTKKYLDENGIRHFGTGDNLDEAWQAAIVGANGIKICFTGASYASVNDNGKTTNNYVARIEDLSHLKSSILNLKSSCDFTVAVMHAGTEYTRKPNQAEMNFAHAAIDAGADLVIGGHPHWIQTTEEYKGKYIFYSLGNFIFDQEWSQDTKEGLILKIQVSKNQVSSKAISGAATAEDLQGSRMAATLDKIELIPVVIENYSTPRPATPEEAKAILDKIGVTESVIEP